MNIFEGTFDGAGLAIAIVASRFNCQCTEMLLKGSHDCLIRHNVEDKKIDTYWVAGSFEIPFILRKIADTKKYHGIIALGAIIRGETLHYELISNEVIKGIAHLNLSTPVPISFGILTTDTLEQALNRSGAKSGNKGFEAALSLLEQINISKMVTKKQKESLYAS